MARMAPKTKRAFDFFVAHANKGGLHPNDWDQFYRFVRIAYRYRSQIWEQDVKQALIKEAFFEEDARYLSTVYCHCWRMLGGFRSPMAAKEWRRQAREERADINRWFDIGGH